MTPPLWKRTMDICFSSRIKRLKSWLYRSFLFPQKSIGSAAMKPSAFSAALRESWPLYTAVAISPSWSKSTEMSGNLLTRRSLFFPYWITCSNNKNWAWLFSIVYGGESGTSAAAGGNVHLLYWRRVWDLPYSSSALQIVRGLLVRVIVT